MILFTAGTFDIPHYGHFNFLCQCAQLFPKSDKLVVALNTDDFVEKYKGKRPVFSYEERRKALYMFAQGVGVFMEVQEGSGFDSRPAIEKSGAKIVLIGNDWLEKDYCKQMGFNAQWLTDHRIVLVYVPHTDNISTTLIKERLK